MSVNWAAKECGVREHVMCGTPMGAKPYLNKNEEQKLEEFLFTTSTIGFGKTRAHVMMYTEMVAKEKGTLRKEHITSRWFDGFCKRHPDVSLCKGDSMSAVRFRCTNQKAIKSYYTFLKTTLTEHNFSAELGEFTM